MPPIPNLSEALTLTRAGMRWAGWGLVVASGLALPFATELMRVWEGSVVAVACVGMLSFLAAMVALVGLAFGFAGRVQSARRRGDPPRARVAVRLAVILESCGWLQLLAAMAMSSAISKNWLTLPSWVAGVGLAVAGVLVIGGWGFHTRYCHLLAVAVDDPTATVPAIGLGSPLLAVAVAMLVGGGFGLSHGWGLLLWVVAAGFVGGYHLTVSNTLRRLAAACRRHTFGVEDSG